MKKQETPPNFNSNSWRFQYLIHDNRTPVIRKAKDLNNIINQLHLTDTYRALDPTTTEYTFCSSIYTWDIFQDRPCVRLQIKP